MKIAIIGAGIVGITTAYELGLDGHDVTVFERRGAAAEEASFANGGIVAPGYVTPWAAPGIPRKMLEQMLQRHAGNRLSWPLGAAELAWMWRWYRACNLEQYLSGRTHMRRLALYSRARLHAIRSDLRLEYDRSDGFLVLLRTERDRHRMQPSLQVLRDAGVAFRQLEPAQARTIEPALHTETPFAAAIQLPGDEVGNCRQFALLLKNEAQRLGVQFRFNCAIDGIDSHTLPALPTLRIRGETTPLAFDAMVVCAGVASLALLRGIGIRLPLLPVHGYSLSATIKEPLNAPRSAVMDEHYKVAISRLGNRVRVAGGAEIGGRPDVKNAASLRTLYKVLQDWFPGATSTRNGVQEWKGARPMLPDGLPIVSASGKTGVWLNLGHGFSGWALSCGSARGLADAIAGKSPEIDLQGFALTRLTL